jgi:hypothetical protein
MKIGEMCEMVFSSFYDIDYFDSGLSSRDRSRERGYYSFDQYKFSRRVAVCEKCGRRFTRLSRSVRDTAARAREEGWTVRKHLGEFVWVCPEHDEFE